MKPWPGVWNASLPGSKCIQYDHSSYSIEGDEDCLYANVYTPKVSGSNMYFPVEFLNEIINIVSVCVPQLPASGKSDKLLSVLVFIHGGAFMFLHGDIYQPDYVLDKDIILVTFNYRLGAIGNSILL